MGKTKVTLSMDEDVVKQAKNIGLNISKTCENALKEAISRLEGSYSSRDPGIYRKPYSLNEIQTIQGDRGTAGSRREGRRGDLNPTSWLH
jgi:hypothetical protein